MNVSILRRIRIAFLVLAVASVAIPAAAVDFYTVTPCRVYDSRPGAPLAMWDLVPANEGAATHTQQVAGTCGVPANATGVALNVTVIGASRAGYLQVFPAGTARPTSPVPPPPNSLSFSPGKTLAIFQMVLLGTGGASGQVSFLAQPQSPPPPSGSYHIAIDVFGYFLDTAPIVASTTPTNGAVGVAKDSNITINFDENVDVTASAFELECPAGSPVGFAVTPAPPGGTNSFTLDPTSDLPEGETCTVTVTATEVTDVDVVDPPDNMEADYTFSFTVDSAPEVASTTPTDGATDVPANSNITINFSENVNVTASAFALECPAGSPAAFTLSPAAPGGTNSFTLDPDSDLPVGTVCSVTVTATEVTDVDAGDPPNTMAADYSFTFTTTDPAPAVTGTTPADGATDVAVGTNITINFNENVNVTASAFTLECPAGSPVAFTLSPAPPGGTNSFTLDPTSDLPVGTVCTVTVVATEVTDVDTVDPPNTMAADHVFTFSTADTAPSVTGTTPTDGATDVAVGTNITVNFSENVNVTASAFALECPSGSPVGFTLSPAAPGGTNSFTLDPTSDLPTGTVCTVTVTATEVSDTDTVDPPNTMAANHVFTFTTADPAPAVTTTTPANGATGVAVNSSITINFNENVNVTASAFALECPSGSPIGFTLIPAAPGGTNSFTLDPTSDLPETTVCTVTVTATEVTDVDTVDPPNTMAANHVFSFTTTDPAPAVTTTSPVNGATQVGADSNVTVNFSENVNVTGSAFTLGCPAAVGFTLIPAAPGGTNSFTLDPTSSLPFGATCTVTVVATEVMDVDPVDPPDTMAANHVFSFTVDEAPFVSATVPTNGAVNVPGANNLSITFSEPVNVTGNWFQIVCTSGVGTTTVNVGDTVVSGGPTTFTINPNADLPGNRTCTVTLSAAQVADQDAGDPPNTMVADHVFSFMTANNAPTVDADTFDTIGNTELRVDLAAVPTTPHVTETTAGPIKGVLLGDGDIDGDPITVDGVVGCADTSAPFVCATANGGTVELEADGRFRFLPLAGDTAASDSFQYWVTDTFLDSVPATVTLRRFERVWYVNNDTDTAGNAGSSIEPFDTLAEAQTTSLANDYIFVYLGDGTSTGQANGIALKAGQHLIGHHHGLSIPIASGTFNGDPAPLNVNLVTAAAGSRPLIDNPGGSAVSATDVIPVEIIGLSLSGSVNAIDLTNSVALPLAPNLSTMSIQNNIIRGAGAEGIDINLNAGTTNTLNLNITGNSWNTAGTHTGNAVDVNRAAGTLNLNFSGNTNIVSAATAVNISGGAIDSTTITCFSANTVHENTVGTGISVSNATFDQTPGGTFQTISGGTTTVGIVGNGVGGSGMVLTSVAGDLSFSNLLIVAANGTGLQASGTTAYTGSAGFQITLANTAATKTVNATGGPALNLNTVSANLPSQTPVATQMTVTSTNTLTSGVTLSSVTGVFSADASSSITKSSGSGTAFSVTTSSVAVNYAGTLNVTSGGGVSLTSNTGVANFSGQLTLKTGANAGFSATGGGTVTANGSGNSIKTTSGTALTVSGTMIGAAGLNFDCISAGRGDAGVGGGPGCTQGDASGTPANGIFLNSTGTGVLTVNGDGSNTSLGGNSSGGVIQNTTGSTGSTAGIGVYVNNARAILRRMNIHDHSNYGIFGGGSMVFNLEYSTVNSTATATSTNGDAAAADDEEGSIAFEEWAGSGAITSSIIGDGFSNNLRVLNTNGADLNRLTVSNSRFDLNGQTAGNDQVHIESRNSGTTLNFTLTGSTVKGARADWFNASANSSSTMDTIITGNTFSNISPDNHPATVANGNRILITANATHTFEVANNTLKGSLGNALAITGAAGGAVLTGDITNNDIGDAAVANSGSTGAGGISVQSGAGADITVLINGNDVRQYNNHGIIFTLGDQMGNAATINATLTNNTTNTPGTLLTDFNGFHVNSGTVSTDNLTSCLNIHDNNFTGGGKGSVAPNNSDVRLRQRQGTTIQLPGYTGPARDNGDLDVAEVITYLRPAGSGGLKNNTFGTGNANSVSTGGGYVNSPGGAACPTPP